VAVSLVVPQPPPPPPPNPTPNRSTLRGTLWTKRGVCLPAWWWALCDKYGRLCRGALTAPCTSVCVCGCRAVSRLFGCPSCQTQPLLDKPPFTHIFNAVPLSLSQTKTLSTPSIPLTTMQQYSRRHWGCIDVTNPPTKTVFLHKLTQNGKV
jgi:hypothetical protein